MNIGKYLSIFIKLTKTLLLVSRSVMRSCRILGKEIGARICYLKHMCLRQQIWVLWAQKEYGAWKKLLPLTNWRTFPNVLLARKSQHYIARYLYQIFTSSKIVTFRQSLHYSIHYFNEITTFSKIATFRESLPYNIHYFNEVTTFIYKLKVAILEKVVIS